MKLSVRSLWTTLACVIVLFGFASMPTGPQALATASPNVTETAAGKAELYIFNSSGWALKPRNQDVTDNGEPLVSLPRNTYRKVLVSPGAHDLRLQGRTLILDAAKGHRYYIIVGYKPERSWGVRHAKDPIVIRQVSEEEAKPLMKEFKAK